MQPTSTFFGPMLLTLSCLVFGGLCHIVQDAINTKPSVISATGFITSIIIWDAKLAARVPSTITINERTTLTTTIPGETEPTTLETSSSISLTDDSAIVSYIQTAIPSDVRSESSYGCFVNSEYSYYATPTWYTTLPVEVQSYYSSINQGNTAACTLADSDPAATSAATTTTSKEKSPGSGLSTGAKVGIGLGAVGTVAAILSALWSIFKGNPCGHSPSSTTPNAPTTAPPKPSHPTSNLLQGTGPTANAPTTSQTPGGSGMGPSSPGPSSPPPGYGSQPPMSQVPMWDGHGGSQAPPGGNGQAGTASPTLDGNAGNQAPAWDGSAGSQAQSGWNGWAGSEAGPSQAPPSAQGGPTFSGEAGSGGQPGHGFSGEAGSQPPPSWSGAAGGEGNWSGVAGTGGDGMLPPTAPAEDGAGGGQIPFVPIVGAAYRRDKKEPQQRVSSYHSGHSGQSGHNSQTYMTLAESSTNELSGVSRNSPWIGCSNENVRVEMPGDSPYFHQRGAYNQVTAAGGHHRTESGHSIPRRPVGCRSSIGGQGYHGVGSPQASSNPRDKWRGMYRQGPYEVPNQQAQYSPYRGISPVYESGSNTIHESGARTVHESGNAEIYETGSKTVSRSDGSTSR